MEEIIKKYIKVTEKMTYEVMKEGTPKETTVKELEKDLYEYFWGLFYENLKEQTTILIFLFKILICLFIIFQIIDNLVKYIDSRRIRSAIFIDEDF